MTKAIGYSPKSLKKSSTSPLAAMRQPNKEPQTHSANLVHLVVFLAVEVGVTTGATGAGAGATIP